MRQIRCFVQGYRLPQYQISDVQKFSNLDLPVVAVKRVSDEAELLVEGAAYRAGVVEGAAGSD